MNPYEAALAVEKVLKALDEILVEVKGLRDDYREGQACSIEVADTAPIDFDKLLQDTFHTSYER